MMKKIVTLLLLLIFYIEPACWATDVIIGADGQARYADGVETPLARDVKIEPAKQDVVQDVKVENVKNKLVVPDVSIITLNDIQNQAQKFANIVKIM